MSLIDEFHSADRPWSSDRIESLVRSIEIKWVMDEKHVNEGDGWYGAKCHAYDKGDPEAVLDCIQLEQAVGSITDHRIRAAVILRMFGFDETDIGAIIRDHRPGWRLVDDGIRAINRYERNRRA